MKHLAALNHSPGAVLFEVNRKTGEISNHVSPQLEFGNDGYNEHLNSINPRMRYSMRHITGHVTYERRFASEDAIVRHEFYDWLSREQGLKYFLGTRLYDVGDISVFHSIEFAKDTDHPERDAIEQFIRTSKRLANAWRLSQHQLSAEPQKLEEAWTPDYLPWGIIALRGDGSVCQMNDQADQILRRKNVIALDASVLDAAHNSDKEPFKKMILNALAGHASSMKLCGVATSSYFIAQAIPVDRGETPLSHPVAALLYLWNPVAFGRDKPQILMKLWNLSLAEANIALQLSRGEALAEAANTLKITRNTARNHLQRIFSKTGTSRQSELVALLFGILETGETHKD